MTIGIASPNPSGLPGFNEAIGIVAGAGNTVANAVPLPSWYNVVNVVRTINDSVTLPPAAWSQTVWVLNRGALQMQVFGNVNPFGVQDLIAVGAGVPGTGAAQIAAGGMAMFSVIIPQHGYTNAWRPGAWQLKILPL